MEKENKADLCSVLVKLGLAVMSVAYPQTGSQASLASAGVDVVLSVVKSVGLLKGEKDDSIDGQLKECIANVLARIQGGRLSDTHRKLMENYIVPRYESWRGNCVKGVPADDIESLFLEWTNTGEANREMYLTELDIRSIDDLFMVLFKEELFKHQGLADWYEMQQIESLDQRFNEVCNLFWGRMGTLEDRISKLENPINPKIEEILRSNPRELLWEASKSVYEISKQEGQRFAYDIIDRLLPNGYIPKLTVPIEGKTEGGQSAPLAELCKAINGHVAIIGNGGTGKTTFLHYLIEQSFAQSPEKFSDLLVYIFIELNRCPTDIVHWHNDPSRKTKFITRYIGALLENHVSLDTVDDRILEYVEKELQKRPDGGKPQYVLLLDGFNEVKIDEGYSIRSLLSNEISTIKKYDNVRIITTSRETQAAYYAAGFTNIRVTGLNDSVIIEHLRGCGKQEYFIAEVMNNKHLVECLRTPLYLCMFASSGENTLLPETQGEILYFFFHRNSSFYNIRKRAVETRTNPLNELQTQLVLDFILPYIGACFESEDIFSVNAGNFGHMILKSVEAVRELFLDAGSNPFVDFHYSKNCLQSTLDSLVEGDIVKTTDVIKCVFDYLGIIYQYQINEGSYVERVRYAFCHHSFRDYFSAIWTVQLLRMLPQVNPSKFIIKSEGSDASYGKTLNTSFWPLEKVALISEILMEHRNKPYLEKQIGNWYTPKPDNDEQAVLAEALDVCRKLCKKTDIHYLQENLLSSILYGRKELTYVDLHGLDLSHSNFFNVICSRKSCFGKVGTNFSGAVLHEDCFHPQNHQDNIIEYIYYEKKCLTLDDSGLIKCWDIVSGKFEYEIYSGDPVGNRDNSTRGYMKISRNKRWLGVKVQESLSSGMSIKLNIFDLDYPQKPPICIIPEGIHSVLSFFAFSDDSKSIALICDANQAFCYELSGNLLYKKVFHGIYRNNEVYFSTAGALAFIFSYEFDPCADLDFDDEEYDGGADEDCDDIAANLGVPCSIWKWNMETGELAVLYCFLGAAHMHPTATYLTGKGAFLIHDGDNNQIKYLNCNTLMEKAVFVPITRENQDPPAAFHHYAEMPAMCMIMYSDCCYLVNIESEINGNNGVLKCFTIKGIEKKLKEKGVDTQLHFSTNVAPSSTQFLAFDNNAKTYEWDSENDTIRAKYNEAYYDTAYLYVSSDRSNAFLVHAYNGISQFSSEPLKLEYQYCYQEHDYTVNVTASDETNNRIALAFADLGHEKVIVMNLETYEEKTIFSTIMPSETVVDLSFSHNGDYVLITTQYKCVEFNLITGEEMIVARSAGQERFLYGNYSGKWIEVTVTEGSEEGLPTRCEFYSKVAKYAGFEFSKEWYYIVPYLPEELYTYYVHGNGDIGKEGPHDENGIQRYRLTRGFFLEDRPEFARILNPECYQVDGDSVTPLCFHFGKLEMICVRHKKALASQKGMENLITYMYLDEKMGEAILARDSADLAWVSNLSSATYEILWGVFDRHIGNDKGYYSWNYVAPWQNNKMIGCFETFHVTLIDRDIGELSVPVEYEPGLALAGCDFSNIRANDSVKELIKNTGGVI